MRRTYHGTQWLPHFFITLFPAAHTAAHFGRPDSPGRPGGYTSGWESGLQPPTPNHAGKAECAHRSSHRTARHTETVSIGRARDFARAVEPEVLLPDPANLGARFSISARSGRIASRVHLPGLCLVVRRRGNRRQRADRLDPVPGAMSVDKSDQHFFPRSSSARAKNADALRRISFARRNSRFSRSSALRRSRSSLFSPPRSPLVDLRAVASTFAASPPYSRSWRPWTRWLPTAIRTRSGARRPSGLRAAGLQVTISSICS